MKKNIIYGVLFILVTLLLPFALTKLLTKHYKETNIPMIDDVLIYTSSDSKMPALDLDHYILGVVLASSPSSFEYETLKAQVVIARTYALKNMMILNEQNQSPLIIDSINPKNNSYTIDKLGLPYISPTAYREYNPSVNTENVFKKVLNALTETKDEVITYKDSIITPLFFLTSAGRTRDSKDIWTTPIPYLKSVDSNQDIESSDYMKISSHTTESVVQLLNEAYKKRELDASDYDYNIYDELPIDSYHFFDSVKIVNRDSAGYVLTVSLGDILVTGDGFAKALSLSSSCFYLEDYEDSVRLICSGSGHGIGFSQYGANVLAKKEKFSYKKLLQYYYTDVNVKSVSLLY